MAGKNSKLNINLPAVDDIFTTQTERDNTDPERVVLIPVSELDPFPGHPFKVSNDEAMELMVNSILEFGVQTPAIVRKKSGNRYELISGHRRKMACELAGIEKLPCVIRDLSSDEAVIAMVDSNLQREVILPSEKAKSYLMRYEALKRQSGRPGKNDADSQRGIRSGDKLGELVGESKDQIRRFIKLNNLNQELLDLVDACEIALRPAVELSYLTPELQAALVEAIGTEECTPSHAQALRMRKLAEAGDLTPPLIYSIMREDKPNQREQFKMPRDRISEFFPSGASDKLISKTVIEALELWRKYNPQ